MKVKLTLLIVVLAISSYFVIFSKGGTATLGSKKEATKSAAAVATPKNTLAKLNTKILFIGDVMLARTIGQSIESGKNPFQFVQPVLDSYDYRIANLETTIADPLISTQAQGKLYTFNAPVVSVETLKKAKIDAVSMANNHTRDFGAAATADMIKNLKKVDIKIAGAGDNIDEAFTPLLVNVPLENSDQLVKIAVIGVNGVENSFTNATSTLAGSAYFDKMRLTGELKTARENADMVVVFPHWGVEYHTTPSDTQISWAHFFIDNGADIVIGSHPHVVQTTENYKGKNIVYSLGNFIFDGMGGNALDGQMIGLEINVKGAIDNKGNFESKTVTVGTPDPIYTHIDSYGFPELK